MKRRTSKTSCRTVSNIFRQQEIHSKTGETTETHPTEHSWNTRTTLGDLFCDLVLLCCECHYCLQTHPRPRGRWYRIFALSTAGGYKPYPGLGRHPRYLLHPMDQPAVHHRPRYGWKQWATVRSASDDICTRSPTEGRSGHLAHPVDCWCGSEQPWGHCIRNKID